MTRPTVSRAVLATAALTVCLSAQVAPDTLAVLTRSTALGLTEIFLAPGAASGTPGPATPILLAPPLDATARSFVVDGTDGSLVVAAEPASGDVELWRVDVTGGVATAQSLRTTLPGTAGLPVRDMTTSPEGCVYVLCGAPFLGATVHRVSVAPNGMVAFAIPSFFNTLDPLSIVVNAAGAMTFGVVPVPNNTSLPAGTATLPPTGGFAVATMNLQFDAHGAAFTPQGALALCGQPRTSGPGAVNYACGGAPQLFNFYPPMFPQNYTPLVDLALEPLSGNFYCAYNGALPSGLGHVARWGATNCATGAAATVLNFASVVLKIGVARPSSRYGCGCPGGNGTLPRVAENGPPTLGQQWVSLLSNAAPNATAQLIVGRTRNFFQNSPIPFDATSLGMPGVAILNAQQIPFPATTTDAAGAATTVRNIPNVPGLIGTNMFSQWFVTETVGGTTTVSTTAGLWSIIQ